MCVTFACGGSPLSHSAECDFLSVRTERKQRGAPAESLRFFEIPFAYAHFNKKSLYIFPQEAVKNNFTGSYLSYAVKSVVSVFLAGTSAGWEDFVRAHWQG